VWGGNDGSNAYVWNPANFNVAYAANAGYATSAGTAGSVTSISTSQVLAATAGASVGAMGTYVFGTINNGGITFGGVYAGSSIVPSGVYAIDALPLDTAASGTRSALVTGTSYLSGSWMAMGTESHAPGTNYSRATLFLRIAL
jgi:hypothetical protein